MEKFESQNPSSPCFYSNSFVVAADKFNVIIEFHYNDISIPGKDSMMHLIAKIAIDHTSAFHLVSQVAQKMKEHGGDRPDKRF